MVAGEIIGTIYGAGSVLTLLFAASKYRYKYEMDKCYDPDKADYILASACKAVFWPSVWLWHAFTGPGFVTAKIHKLCQAYTERKLEIIRERKRILALSTDELMKEVERRRIAAE